MKIWTWIDFKFIGIGYFSFLRVGSVLGDVGYRVID